MSIKESVWDYPRPPLAEPATRHIVIEFGGETIADTTRAIRVLETSHPPVYYIPREDIRMEFLSESPHRSFCEFKGTASYWNVKVKGKAVPNCAWSYKEPSQNFSSLKGCVAFYPGKMDACYVDDEQVKPQPGDFYGGWITSEIDGPFKGGPGSGGW